MINQVLGLLFGSSDDDEEKTGESPKMPQRYGNSSSSLSTISHANTQQQRSSNRKRGRPLKGQDSIVSSSRKQDSFSFDNSYASKSLGSFRRSRRYKPPDPSKEIIILMPENDPIKVLNVDESEKEDFELCMNDPIELDYDEEETSDHHVASTGVTSTSLDTQIMVPRYSLVHRPKTTRITLKNKNYFLSSSIPSHLNQAYEELLTSCSYDYTEYNLDDADEVFLQKELMNEISVSQFENMFAILDREYEETRLVLLPLLSQSSNMANQCDSLLLSTKKYLHQINSILDDVETNSNSLSSLSSVITKLQQVPSSSSSSSSSSLPSYPLASNPSSSLRLVSDKMERETSMSSPPTVNRKHTHQPTIPEIERVLQYSNISSLLYHVYPNREVNFQVFKYYLRKRSTTSSAMLRCYHDFLMENWTRETNVITRETHYLVNDLEAEKYFSNQKSLLLLYRNSFDKARLIVDRVRRREKLKRDFIRLSNEICEAHVPMNEETKYSIDYQSYPYAIVEPNTSSHSLSLNVSLLTSLPLASKPLDLKSNSHKSLASSSSTSTVLVSSWSLDEDKLLLLGVAACGLGRWTEIRDDFALSYRNSAQMNQRFFRLVRRLIIRLQQVEEADDGSSPNILIENSSSIIINSNGSTKKPPTLQLSNTLAIMLRDFNEEEVWNRVALRFMFDQQVDEKRSGRPIKHPVNIPIPKEYQYKGYLKYKHLLYKPPSSPQFQLSQYSRHANANTNTNTSISSGAGDSNTTNYRIASNFETRPKESVKEAWRDPLRISTTSSSKEKDSSIAILQKRARERERYHVNKVLREKYLANGTNSKVRVTNTNTNTNTNNSNSYIPKIMRELQPYNTGPEDDLIDIRDAIPKRKAALKVGVMKE